MTNAALLFIVKNCRILSVNNYEKSFLAYFTQIMNPSCCEGAAS